MKIYLDTNILIDLLCRREPFYPYARQLFALAYTRKITITISALSYINAVYICKKYQYPADEVLNYLKQIASFTFISDITNTSIRRALDSGWKDFEDSAQYHSALEVSVDCIVTRNPKDFEHSSLPVYTPEEFLKLI